ncbi:hypothetical protein BTVI_01933 [Pitangus sulphuratus]|nr:hypothetical protein BTVI_01933 [Pitangus sulphuratus]
MKVSCTHFQCAAGAFTYLRDHFPHSYSVDMSHQILSLNINLMLGQAQECLLEKSMLDNRKSFLVARISAQVSSRSCSKHSPGIRNWRGTLGKGLEGQDTGNGFPLPEGRFGWDIGKEFLAVREVKDWNGFLREAVAAPSLGVSKARLDGAWSNLCWGQVSQ